MPERRRHAFFFIVIKLNGFMGKISNNFQKEVFVIKYPGVYKRKNTLTTKQQYGGNMKRAVAYYLFFFLPSQYYRYQAMLMEMKEVLLR